MGSQDEGFLAPTRPPGVLQPQQLVFFCYLGALRLLPRVLARVSVFVWIASLAMSRRASRTKEAAFPLISAYQLGSYVLTGALKGSRGGCWGGDEGATLTVVCGVGGVMGAGTVCVDRVEEGVCGGGGAWFELETAGDCCGRGGVG